MTNSRLARSAFVFAAIGTIAAIGACSKGATSAAPAPAPAPSSSASTAAARPAAPAAAMFTAAMVKEGDSLYHARGCKNCHGPAAMGAANGPALVKASGFMHVNGSYDDFVRIITTGVPAADIKDQAHKIPMPARGGRPAAFTDDQIKATAAYVYSLNHP